MVLLQFFGWWSRLFLEGLGSLESVMGPVWGSRRQLKRQRFLVFSFVIGVAAYIVGSGRLLRCFSVFIVWECDCSTRAGVDFGGIVFENFHLLLVLRHTSCGLYVYCAAFPSSLCWIVIGPAKLCIYRCGLQSCPEWPMPPKWRMFAHVDFLQAQPTSKFSSIVRFSLLG